MDEQPSLGQLIWLVRRELEWAHEVDAKQPLRFDVGTVELNVDVEATRVKKGEAGLDLKVVAFGGGKAGGSLESTQATTSKVRVVLTPRDMRSVDGRYQISAADVEPPPRRAEVVPSPAATAADDDAPASAGAVHTEPPPARS
ncbi:MAG: hypothetical protein M3228_01515 [Actinomycetota bacterium]|nr:hypothetical protein [Actinomycetota bacterium]